MLKLKSSKPLLPTLFAMLILPVVLVGASSFVQSKKEMDANLSFTGKVTEIAYDIPIGGVKVKCENVTTTTAADGSFTLNVPDKNKQFYKIHFSKKGYMNDHLDNIPAKSDKIYISLMKKAKK